MKKTLFYQVIVIVLILITMLIDFYVLKSGPPIAESNGNANFDPNNIVFAFSDIDFAESLFESDADEATTDENKFWNLELNPVVFADSSDTKNQKEYTITFLAKDGQVLETVTVDPNKGFTPPMTPPVPPDEIFTGWNDDFKETEDNQVVKEETISVAEMDNAIAISAGYGVPGGKVTLPLQLCGKVNLCGLDLMIQFNPQELQFKEFSYEDDAVICNFDNNTGEVKLNFLTMRNVTSAVDLCDMIFEIVGDADEAKLTIDVKTIIAFDENQNIITPDYRTIHGTVRVIK